MDLLRLFAVIWGLLVFKDASITLQKILIPFGNAGLVRAPGFCFYTVEALYLILSFKASRHSCGLEQLYSLRNLIRFSPSFGLRLTVVNYFGV